MVNSFKHTYMRALSYYASRNWNQLPEEIRCAPTVVTFKFRLKTHLFSCAFTEWVLCHSTSDWLHCILFCILHFILNWIQMALRFG